MHRDVNFDVLLAAVATPAGSSEALRLKELCAYAVTQANARPSLSDPYLKADSQQVHHIYRQVFRRSTMHRDIASLPIAAFLPTLLESTAQVLIISAETGSGKTVGFPYALAEAGRSALVLEPLIASCEGAAEYVSSLFGETVGQRIGIAAGETRRPGRQVTYATTAIGLVRAVLDAQRMRVGYLCVDEFHERRADQDVIFAWALQRLAAGDAPFGQLVLMSATLDVPAVERHIRAQGLSVETFTVPGRSYAVTYRPCESVLTGIAAALSAGADVLAFQPGKAEIEATVASVRKAHPAARVFAYHSQLSNAERHEALDAPQRGNTPVVIVSTNALETGRTITPRTGVPLHVVDSGLERQECVTHGVAGLALQPISQAQQRQRGGRTGRVSAGVCWQVVSDVSRPAYPVPEIRRTLLARLMLSVAAAGLDLASLPLFDAPDTSALQAARQYLTQIRAIDGSGITDHGRDLIRWPTDPRWAQVLQRSCELGCLADAVSAVALAESGGVDGRETPAPARGEDWLSWQSRLLTSGQGVPGALARVRQTISAIRRAIPAGVTAGKETGSMALVRRAWASAHPDTYGVVGFGRRGASVDGYNIGRPLESVFFEGERVVYTYRVIHAPKGAFTVCERVIRLDAVAAAEIAPDVTSSELILDYYGQVQRVAKTVWGRWRLSATEQRVEAPTEETTALLMSQLDSHWYAGQLRQRIQGARERVTRLVELGFASPITAEEAETAARGAIAGVLGLVTCYGTADLAALDSLIDGLLADVPTVPDVADATGPESVVEFTACGVTRYLLRTQYGLAAYGSRLEAESACVEALASADLPERLSALYMEADRAGAHGIYQRVYRLRWREDRPTLEQYQTERAALDAFLEAQKAAEAERLAAEAAQAAADAKAEAERAGARDRLIAAVRQVCPGCPVCGQEWTGWEEFPAQPLKHPQREGRCVDVGTFAGAQNDAIELILYGMGRRGRDLTVQPEYVLLLGDTPVAYMAQTNCGDADYQELHALGPDPYDAGRWSPFERATGDARLVRRSDYEEPVWCRVTFDQERTEQTYGGSIRVLSGRADGEKGVVVEYRALAGDATTLGTYEYPKGLSSQARQGNLTVREVWQLRRVEASLKLVEAISTPVQAKPVGKPDLSGLLAKFGR